MYTCATSVTPDGMRQQYSHQYNSDVHITAKVVRLASLSHLCGNPYLGIIKPPLQPQRCASFCFHNAAFVFAVTLLCTSVCSCCGILSVCTNGKNKCSPNTNNYVGERFKNIEAAILKIFKNIQHQPNN